MDLFEGYKLAGLAISAFVDGGVGALTQLEHVSLRCECY